MYFNFYFIYLVVKHPVSEGESLMGNGQIFLDISKNDMSFLDVSKKKMGNFKWPYYCRTLYYSGLYFGQKSIQYFNIQKFSMFLTACMHSCNAVLYFTFLLFVIITIIYLRQICICLFCWYFAMLDQTCINLHKLAQTRSTLRKTWQYLHI